MPVTTTDDSHGQSALMRGQRLIACAYFSALLVVAGAAACLGAPTGGVAFNGQTSYAVVEKLSQLDWTPLTVSAWVKVKRIDRPQVFLNRGQAGGMFTFYIFSERVRMLVSHVPGKYAHANCEPPKPNVWTHYAGTYDGETIKVYCNGALMHSTKAKGKLVKSKAPLFIGALSSFERHLDGWLDNVSIWSRALSAEEINAASSNAGPANGLVAHWTTTNLEGETWRNAAGDAMHAAYYKDPKPVARKDTGYRGIWYANQKLNNEYVYKYSGGLGTYCAKHIPFAVYAKAANKTFFCYGGRPKDRNTLVHMVSYFDHETGLVPQPTLLLDKRTADAHDNPVMQIDDEGYISIFSSSHGRGRPSFVNRSTEPYSITGFERVMTTNFSYPQAHYMAGKGFLFLHTLYLGGRFLHQWRSADGREWGKPRVLAKIERGHYQVSWTHGTKAATAFNYHPQPKGLNWRTNLYYMETRDFGETWRTVRGEALKLPLTKPKCDALVREYQAEGLLVYMKDIQFDAEGNPIILYITSKGFESGPENGPRTWTTARWTGRRWEFNGSIKSDNNYDMGSLYIEAGGLWRIIGPTQPGPQPFNPGGEVALWTSADQGKNWRMVKQITSGSEFNHTYVRRPVNAHPGFYAFWADGHGRKPSESRLYFTDREGSAVWRLPAEMDGQFAKPEVVGAK
ncbi:MAG: BNR-4 repeat-containing protein [Planctomycetota bacterium]|nr:BNR-4 repeat-containing protein [Planctomycetota bacterium]